MVDFNKHNSDEGRVELQREFDDINHLNSQLEEHLQRQDSVIDQMHEFIHGLQHKLRLQAVYKLVHMVNDRVLPLDSLLKLRIQIKIVSQLRTYGQVGWQLSGVLPLLWVCSS